MGKILSGDRSEFINLSKIPKLFSIFYASDDGEIHSEKKSCFCTFSTVDLYLITFLLTPWSTVLLEKLTGSAASQEIPRIYGTRRFITVLTSARHLPYHEPVPTTPSHFLKIHLNIILPSTSGSPQWSLSLRVSHQKPVHTSSIPHTRHMSRASHYRFVLKHKISFIRRYNEPIRWIP